ncbi:MAG TPA: hypothetical protein ENF64_02315 [Hadesarchaea archaeon]|nr:hypothetical protein [Hadesarchaea archaeon]
MKKRFVVMIFLISALFALTTVARTEASGNTLTITSEAIDDELRPGEETTVLLTLANLTTVDITDVEVRVSAGSHLTVSDTLIDVGDIKSGYSRQVSFNVTASLSAPATTSYLTVKTTYYSPSKHEEITNIVITITTAPMLQIENVDFTQVENEEPGSVGPGDTVRLEFDLVNNGDGSAKDVRISLDQSDLYVALGSSENFVKEIKPGDSVNLSFTLTIDPSASAGTHQIPLSLTYLDETGNENSVTKYIGMTISGKYNFILTVYSQDISFPGEESTVTVKFVNAGNQRAQFLTVYVSPTDALSEVFPQTVYIGSLNSDDYDTQKFNFRASNVPPGEYPLTLELHYEDIYGDNYVEQHQVYIKISPAPGLLERILSSSYFTGGIVLIILVGLYLSFRRSKNKK